MDHLGLVEEIVRGVARRHRIRPEEAEELAAAVHVKLIEGNYDVLRKYEGRSSLRTYLTVVVNRLQIDRMVKRYGKWRPSIQARRLGAVAVLLDRMLTRDGRSLDEACELLQNNHRVTESRDDIEALAARLPKRQVRRFLGDEVLEARAAPDSPEFEAMQQMDVLPAVEHVGAALTAALSQLGDEDRLLLRMRFEDGLQIAEISRMLCTAQKPLYRRLERVMLLLRRELEARGVDRTEIDVLMEVSTLDLPSLALGKRVQ